MGLGVPPAGGVTSVPASILPSHVHDQRFRALRLNLEGGDERVFGVDHHMFGFALQLQSDSELQRALRVRFSLTLLGQGNQKKPAAAGAGPITQIGCEAGTDIVAAPSIAAMGHTSASPVLATVIDAASHASA